MAGSLLMNSTLFLAGSGKKPAWFLGLGWAVICLAMNLLSNLYFTWFLSSLQANWVYFIMTPISYLLEKCGRIYKQNSEHVSFSPQIPIFNLYLLCWSLGFGA